MHNYFESSLHEVAMMLVFVLTLVLALEAELKVIDIKDHVASDIRRTSGISV